MLADTTDNIRQRDTTFDRTQCWITIGANIYGKHHVVRISSAPPQCTLHPPNSPPYITTHIYSFCGIRQGLLRLVVGTLRSVGVYPCDDPELFHPPLNPDNQYYSNLPTSKLGTILSTVEALLHVLTIGPSFEPEYSLEVVDQETLARAAAQIQPTIELGGETLLLCTVYPDGRIEKQDHRPGMAPRAAHKMHAAHHVHRARRR